MKRLWIYFPLDEMLVHSGVTPPPTLNSPLLIYIAYTWVDKGIVRVMCLAQEHNVLDLNWTELKARSGEERSIPRPPRLPPQERHSRNSRHRLIDEKLNQSMIYAWPEAISLQLLLISICWLIQVMLMSNESISTRNVRQRERGRNNTQIFLQAELPHYIVFNFKL